LLDVDPRTSRGRLLSSDLVDHSLLIAASPGRYRRARPDSSPRPHPGRQLDPEPERAAAQDRLLHYYAHTAQSASVAIARWPRPDRKARPRPTPPTSRPGRARTWLRAEQPNLEAAFIHAGTHGLDQHAIALAAGLAEILRTDGPWTRALHVHHTAAETAERLSRPAAHANALTDLGRVRHMTGDYQGP
jgi:hypothetical protein